MQQVPIQLQEGLEPATIMVVIIVEVMVIVVEVAVTTIKEAAIIISIFVEAVIIIFVESVIIQIVEGVLMLVIIIVGEGSIIEIKAIGWEEHTILIHSLSANRLLK